MKIAITAFEPFDNRDLYVSQEVLKNIKSSKHQIDKYFLKVSWNDVLEPLSNIKDQNYDYIIHLGEAASYPDITLELKAKNKKVGKDNYNISFNGEKIIESEIESLDTSFDKKRAEHLAHIINAKLGNDAGCYLCNYTYFYSLNMNKKSKVLFIHLPIINTQSYKGEKGKFELSDLVSRINKLIEEI